MLQVGPHVRPHTSFVSTFGGIDHFAGTFDTEKLGGTGSATKVLVMPYASGVYTTHWGDGSFDTLNSHTYASGGEWFVEVFEPVTTFRYNNTGDCLKLVDMISLGDGFEINNSGVWNGCRNMVYSTTDTPIINSANLSNTFSACEKMNGNVGNWDLSLCDNLTNMFFGAFIYVGTGIESWDVGNCTNFSQMFFASPVSAPIGSWDMTSATTISGMFRSSSSFNVDVDAWDTSNIQTMNHVFNGTSMTHDLNNWDMGSVVTIHAIFGSTAYNGDITGWTFTSAISDTSWAFANAISFNQDVSGWNMASVTNTSNMFGSASSFNQDLTGWNVGSVTNMATMFDNSGMSRTNYDNFLIMCSGQTVQSGVTLGAQGLSYSSAGVASRDDLVDNDLWTITDEGEGRNFTTLDLTFDMHYPIPTHTSSADFTHTVDFTFVDLTAQVAVLSGGVNAVNESFIRLDPTDGSVDLLVNQGGFLAGSAAAFTPDRNTHTLSLARVGNDYTIRLDGSIIQVFNQTAADFLVDNIGVRADSMSQRFSGVLADVNLASGERDYFIDERWTGSTPILVDYGTDGLDGTSVNTDSDDSELFTPDGIDWLGLELITNGEFDADTNWNKGSGWTISAGTASYDGTGGTSNLNQTGLDVRTNYSYKTSLDVVANTGTGTNPIDIGALRYNFDHLAAGFHSFIEEQTTGTDYMIFGRASEPLEIDNVLVKRILQGTP